jgi:chromosome segregation ATPase
MSEFSWETEQQHSPSAAENESGQSHAPETVSLSASDFAAIEERIVRAVELVRRERQLRSEAEARAASAEARVEQADSALREQMASADELGKELAALRVERNQVRDRVERLLSQLDALEL